MAQITKEMSISQVLRIDTSTARIFMQYGMHCMGCPHATRESIEQAGAVHGIDVDALIKDLNDHVGE